MSERADIVIGSGPAGVAVAAALLDQGREVILIDGGKALEADRAQVREALAARPPESWSPEERAAYMAPQFATPEGQARRFGSDFAMEPPEATLARGADACGLRSSRAVGGLSNLWGGAVLPHAAQDMAGWPIGPEDLRPHFAAIAQLVPVAGRPEGDRLADLFPAARPQHDLPRGSQAEALLARLERAAGKMARQGVVCGPSRVAVAPGCTGCGLCLHGCPWRLIFSADQSLGKLKEGGRLRHLAGRIALGISESADGAEVALEGGERLHGGRVFVAAGVLESARLMMASGLAQELSLQDSQHGFLPLVRLRKGPGQPGRMPFTTLPQAFAELRDPDVSPHLVHAQLYGWNAFYARDLMAGYGRNLALFAPVFNALARRLIVAQIFLHSAHSARIDLRLAGDGRIEASPVPNPETPRLLKRAAGRFAAALRHAGLHALIPAMRPGPIGSSFHVGASLPMARAPGSGETDLLGRPAGLERIHVVDASVLPAIPATTITLSVMANAHRIGALAP